jgi:molybdenum cofactor synthesis domain-containing protein
MSGKIITAGMVTIGDELLSGRTRDRNIGQLAATLTAAGIDLREVRIVPDEEERIVEAVNALRQRYTYLFTSGGIGPTHDDITADAIGAAFGVPVDHHPEAMELLSAHYASRGLEFTDARKRMARLPRGAAMIGNPVSVAPGFTIGNVHVMAGVPSIFEAMLDQVMPSLETGVKMLSRSVDSPFPEGRIGGPLGEIQKQHKDTAIGSYPRFNGSDYSTQIVIRSREPQALEAAEADVRAMLAEIARG